MRPEQAQVGEIEGMVLSGLPLSAILADVRGRAVRTALRMEKDNACAAAKRLAVHRNTLDRNFRSTAAGAR